MNKYRSLLKLVLATTLIACIGANAQHIVSPLAAFGAIMLLFAITILLPKAKYTFNVYTNGISQEIWENHIEENLYKNNEFLLQSVDDSEYVNYKTVHIPNAGANPNVQKNRALGGAPANVNQRTDTPQDYSIDEYTTDPFLISNAEEVELSYNKRESILYQHEMTIRQTISDNILVDWAPTAATLSNIIRSSGIPNNDPSAATRRVSASYLPGSTGSRNNYTVYDILQAQMYLDSLDVPEEGRCMLWSAQAYQQFILDLTATQYRDFSSAIDPKTGVIGRLFGFDFYKRSSVVKYNNAATPVVKAVGAVNAVDDNDSVLFWNKAFLSRAVGDIRIFNDENSPVYYGDVYSVLIRMGGAKRRTSELGVGAIVQSASNGNN